MAITAGICNSYKREILSGTHQASHTYKLALYTDAATLSKSTTAYTSTGEVDDGNGYATGGLALAGFVTSLSGDTAVLTFDTPIAWHAASFTARGALIYNASAGNRAVVVLDFGQNFTATNGTFTVNLPAPDAYSGLVRAT